MSARSTQAKAKGKHPSTCLEICPFQPLTMPILCVLHVRGLLCACLHLIIVLAREAIEWSVLLASYFVLNNLGAMMSLGSSDVGRL